METTWNILSDDNRFPISVIVDVFINLTRNINYEVDLTFQFQVSFNLCQDWITGLSITP